MRNYIRESYKVGQKARWIFHYTPGEFLLKEILTNLIVLMLTILVAPFVILTSIIKWIFTAENTRANIVLKIIAGVMIVLVFGGAVYFFSTVLPELRTKEASNTQIEQAEDSNTTGVVNNQPVTEVYTFADVPDAVKPEFIFWDSDRRLLTDAEVMNLDPIILQTAINEIYARHGRIYADENWNNYFISKSWYVPRLSAKEFDESVFNDFEKQNISLLASYRK